MKLLKLLHKITEFEKKIDPKTNSYGREQRRKLQLKIEVNLPFRYVINTFFCVKLKDIFWFFRVHSCIYAE